MLSYKSLSIATVLLFLRGSLAATCGTRTTSELQGFDTLQSEQRYWYLRDKLCGDNGAGCESSNSCEVRLDRSGNSLTLTRSGTDKKTQDCYDATANIIQQCVRDGEKIEGEWTYNDFTISYALSYSATSTPAHYIAATAAPSATQTASGAFACASNAPARKSDCGNLGGPTDDTTFTGSGNCIPSTVGYTPDGHEFCIMYQQNSCAFTVVDLSGKGIDQVTFDLKTYNLAVLNGALTCPLSSLNTLTQTYGQLDGNYRVCLINALLAGLC